MNNDIEMADNLDNQNNDDYNIDELFENTFNYKSKKGNNKTNYILNESKNSKNQNKLFVTENK